MRRKESAGPSAGPWALVLALPETAPLLGISHLPSPGEAAPSVK